MMKLESGDSYQGTWSQDDDGNEVIHGKGVYVFANGSQFVGYFYEGSIVGKGRIIFHNGDIYEGDFIDQQYGGKGKYIFGASHFVDGFYEGEFQNNKITGKGKI